VITSRSLTWLLCTAFVAACAEGTGPRSSTPVSQGPLPPLPIPPGLSGHIAYTVYADTGGIFLLDLTNGRTQRLTQSSYHSAPTRLLWAPSGTSLVFVLTYKHGSGSTGYVMDSVRSWSLATAAPNAPPQPAPCAVVVGLTSDGHYACLRSDSIYIDTAQVYVDSLVGICSMNGDGDNVSVGPSGRSLVFVGEPPVLNWGYEGCSLYRLNPADSSLQIILAADTGGHFGSPAISPAGDRVAFETWPPLPPASGPVAISVVGIDGTNRRRISSGCCFYAPSWSPDGQWIAFWRAETDTLGGIWVAKADGSIEVQILRGGARPAWGP
jgi:Tol biopolymer transport system component